MPWRCALRLLVFACLGICSVPTSVADEISFARPATFHSIQVDAEIVERWESGRYEVLHLKNQAVIQQQDLELVADSAILWVEKPDTELLNEAESARVFKIICYLEGNVEVRLPSKKQSSPNKIVDETWYGRLFTSGSVNLRKPSQKRSGPPPEIFHRASETLSTGWQSSVQPSQFQDPVPTNSPTGGLVVNPQTGVVQRLIKPVEEQPTRRPPPIEFKPSGRYQSVSQKRDSRNGDSRDSRDENGLTPAPNSQIPTPNLGSIPSGFSTVEFGPRYPSVEPKATSSASNNPNERIVTLIGGVRVTIKSPELTNLDAFRGDEEQELTILANNLVGWVTTTETGQEQWEIYLEGNVVFTKDRRVIYADKMYYNPTLQTGTILSAEVLTPAQKYDGLVRLKADVIQQVDANNLQAYGAAFTSSRMGVPRYWLQSENMLLTRQSTTSFDPMTGLPAANSQAAQAEDQYFVEANRNRVYVSGIPVFLWPRYRADLENPTLFVDHLKIGNDNIFGTQVQTAWNMYQLLGIRNPPKGFQTIGLLDYLSERGLGFGSETTYRTDNFFGLPGVANGVYKSWFIDDDGVDFLGRGRANLTPEETFRGRTIWQHRQQFGPGSQLRVELGYLSDRNFLEQFYEREWDSYKDAKTGLWLERNVGTQSFNLMANLQINDFFTQTSWLPRLDHFVVGQPLFGDRVIWSSHSQVGYGRLRIAEPPLNASELAKFDPLAWEGGDVDGIRTATRHSLEFPIQAGPTKIVPYVLGELAYWQEDLTGNDLFRGYGQFGVRASLPFWKVDPTIQSTLWNVNGLSHKVTFDVDAFFADASQDLGSTRTLRPFGRRCPRGLSATICVRYLWNSTWRKHATSF